MLILFFVQIFNPFVANALFVFSNRLFLLQFLSQ